MIKKKINIIYMLFIILCFFTYIKLDYIVAIENVLYNINLIDAVNSNNIEKVKEIIKSDTTKIPRLDFEKAIYIAASKGYVEIFNLLEPFVSRQAHRNAFYMLFCS